jgi:hypothetical protein
MRVLESFWVKNWLCVSVDGPADQLSPPDELRCPTTGDRWTFHGYAPLKPRAIDAGLCVLMLKPKGNHRKLETGETLERAGDTEGQATDRIAEPALDGGLQSRGEPAGGRPLGG